MFFKYNLKLILEPEIPQVGPVGKNRCRYALMNSVDYVEKPGRKGRSIIKLTEIKWLVHLFLEGNINFSTLRMEVVIMEPHDTGSFLEACPAMRKQVWPQWSGVRDLVPAENFQAF